MVSPTATHDGKGGKRPKGRFPLYFFLNDKLHKRFHINRGQDIITTWSYSDAKRVKYSYTDSLHRHEKAWSTKQVAVLINRNRIAIQLAIGRGDIEEPPYNYTLDEKRRKIGYFWREKDIMAVHAYFAGVHRGRPRKDGLVTNSGLPTPRELRAAMHGEQILYIKQGDQFVPTFRAKEY